MKNTPLVKIFLITSLFLTLATTSSIILVQRNAWPGFNPNLYFEGNYFYINDANGTIFNISTGNSSYLSDLVSPCVIGDHTTFLYTSQNNFYCYLDTSKSIEWHQFSPSNFSVLDSFTYNYPPDLLESGQSDIYISYIFENQRSLLFSALIYNLDTQEYFCNISAADEEYLLINYDFTGYGLLYPSPALNNFAYFSPCYATAPIKSPLSTVGTAFVNGFLNFNRSSVYFGSGPNQNNVYISQATLIDLTGRVYGGPIYEYEANQFNDTHLIATYQQGGYWFVGLFTITPTLNIINVAAHNSSISTVYKYFSADVFTIQGSNAEFMVSDSLTGGSGYIYSFEQQEITAAFAPNAPFQLGNGSTVNLTNFGYFIQSPGEPIYFFQAPNNIIYIDPAFNDVWTLLLPTQFTQYYGYNYSQLTHFQRNTSTITTYNFTSFPFIPLTYPTIGDINFDSQGNPIIIIVDKSIYIMTLKTFSLVMPAPNYVGMEISVDVSANTGTMVFFTTEDFMINKFYLNNGTTYSSSKYPVIPGQYQGNYIQKLNSQYFFLASCNLSHAEFVVWDSVNQNQVSQVAIASSFITTHSSDFSNKVLQYPVQGITGSSSSSLDSIVWVNTNEFYVRDSTGTVTTYQLPNEEINSIEQLSVDTFWVGSQTESAFYWRYYSL